jgi:hypothetical protein
VAAVGDIGTTGPLVGRADELDVLGAAIGQAAAGSLQVVAISGEAGIGKSRLAHEGLRAAGEKGFRTVESAAGRLHRDLSYAPIVEALRPLVAESGLVDGLRGGRSRVTLVGATGAGRRYVVGGSMADPGDQRLRADYALLGGAASSGVSPGQRPIDDGTHLWTSSPVAGYVEGLRPSCGPAR